MALVDPLASALISCLFNDVTGGWCCYMTAYLVYIHPGSVHYHPTFLFITLATECDEGWSIKSKAIIFHLKWKTVADKKSNFNFLNEKKRPHFNFCKKMVDLILKFYLLSAALKFFEKAFISFWVTVTIINNLFWGHGDYWTKELNHVKGNTMGSRKGQLSSFLEKNEPEAILSIRITEIIFKKRSGWQTFFPEAAAPDSNHGSRLFH